MATHPESIPENQPYAAVNTYDDEYEAEFDAAGSLNLGAESPGSILRPITPLTPATAEPDEWSTSALGKSMNTNVPARDRLWRSSSFHKRVVSKKSAVVDDASKWP
ncbi:hypothetical protein ONZ45_g6180 [Pleurotus djamor]|nr:hypothetical protein ONZ45_g6180 [Pleurotus djamor]